MKPLLLFCILAIGFSLAQKIQSDFRLIEFSETERKWLSTKYIEDVLASECGTGKHGGFIDVTEHQYLNASGAPRKIQEYLKASPFPQEPTHQDIVKPLIASLSKETLKQYNDKLSSYFTRYYTTATGRESAEWIYDQFITLKGDRTDISVTQFKHSWGQPSIIARIPGAGPNSDEVVIIGAHEDSTVGKASSRSPGADDDASGTSTVLEIFRVLVAGNFHPSRTVEFHTYAAEEVGLLGSMAVASSYQANAVPVFSMMQLDMTFYTRPGVTPVFGIITDYVNADLTTFLKALVESYSELGYQTSKCGYGCSDHASWTKAGYASCFPFETAFVDLNPYIHTSEDTIDKLNLDHGLEFAKVGLGYIVELSL